MTRTEEINQILVDIEILRQGGKYDSYSLDELVAFFESTKSIFKYILWLLFRAPKLDSKRLLEINDLPFSKYERKMHEKLIAMEKQKFPGLISLQVKALSKYIFSKSENLCLASFGSGGMEAERQVLKNVIQNNYSHKLVLVGIDYSQEAHNVARQNLSEFSNLIKIIELDKLDTDILSDIVQKNEKYTVVLCKNNVFDLNLDFKENFFDVVFHTLFKHHLTEEQQVKIDNVIKFIGKNCFEYDGYRSWFAMLPQTIVGWNNPIFLNAEIFSNLRFKKKSQVKVGVRKGTTIQLNPMGYYLLKSEL